MNKAHLYTLLGAHPIGIVTWKKQVLDKGNNMGIANALFHSANTAPWRQIIIS